MATLQKNSFTQILHVCHTFHIKTPRPAQLPNQQWVSGKNQVHNFTGLGTETMCEIWRSHVAERGDYCLRAESGINKAPLQREEFSITRCQSLFQ